jgi:hypothetical protein
VCHSFHVLIAELASFQLGELRRGRKRGPLVSSAFSIYSAIAWAAFSGLTTAVMRALDRLAAHAALPRAFVLGHVTIETCKAAERAAARRAVVCWVVKFVLVVEDGERVTWGAISLR